MYVLVSVFVCFMSSFCAFVCVCECIFSVLVLVSVCLRLLVFALFRVCWYLGMFLYVCVFVFNYV